MKSFDTLSDFEKTDTSQMYDRRIGFTLSKRQDALAKIHGILESTFKRNDLTAFTNNCGDVVRRIAHVAGLKIENDTIFGITIPNKQFNEAVKMSEDLLPKDKESTETEKQTSNEE
ncbi:hypothetical protein GF406_09135 [candidate division KSB1 bacterium]|nr:hypothetical protein [candidate division KSB1 bacterium]